MLLDFHLDTKAPGKEYYVYRKRMWRTTINTTFQAEICINLNKARYLWRERFIQINFARIIGLRTPPNLFSTLTFPLFRWSDTKTLCHILACAVPVHECGSVCPVSASAYTILYPLPMSLSEGASMSKLPHILVNCSLSLLSNIRFSWNFCFYFQTKSMK